MALEVPVDSKSANEINLHFRQWMREPSIFWLDAFSYLHSVRMPDLHGGPRVKPKAMANHYWGRLGVFDSNLVWGSVSLHPHSLLVIPFEWLDVIFVDPGLRPATVRFGPPPEYGVLMVQISPRKLTRMPKAEFPGTRYVSELEPVHDGQSVMWGFAVNLSSGVHLLDRLHRHLRENKERFGSWSLEGEGLKRGLIRVEEEIEDLPAHAPPQPDEYSLIDLIFEEMSDEEVRQYAVRSEGDPTVESVFCGQCGVRNPASSNFCAKCGAKLVKL